MKKVFSVKDGSLCLNTKGVYLFLVEGISMIATTKESEASEDVYSLPSTLIRTPKTDEELAEEYYKSFDGIKELRYSSFLAGRKSVKGEFHLTKEDLLRVYNAMIDNITFTNLIASLTTPIYPHTIEIEVDGENYLWETIKASYE
jgi:hypothetical protein